MESKRKPIYRVTFVMLLMIFPIAILGKIYQYKFTAAVNFGIMSYILNIVNTGKYMGMKAYDFPAKVYSVFKFLGFKTNLEWSIFYTAIFTVIIFILLLKYKKYSFKEYIFIYASMFILSWTVMNMNKDLIQLMFLLIIYIVCSQPKINDKIKILISSLIFFIESIVFREYYILVAGLLIITYFILSGEIRNNGKKHYIRDIVVIFAIFFLGIYLCKFISTSSYEQLVNRRDHLDQIEEVNTIIDNKISGNSYGIFILNYVINFIRICFPIELIFYGAKHCIFFIYQLMITFSLIKSLKNLNKNNVIYISIILAYTIMLVASESDFGTLVRHQSVLLMFYIGMFQNMPRKEVSNEK